MHRLFTLATVATLLLLTPQATQAQKGEFGNDSTSFMYSDETMGQLKFIVDSLNIKFKACEVFQTYYSKSQARGHYIDLSQGKVKAATEDLNNGISFEDFIQKYPKAKVEKDLLVTRWKYTNYEDKEVVQFSAIEVGDHGGQRLRVENRPEVYAERFVGKWAVRYYEKGKYNDESVRAFFFPKGFESKQLAPTYTKMVQYVDCMIDTTQDIFVDAKETSYHYGEELKLDSMTMEEKQNKLVELRGTRVVGGCSMDDSPRHHARKIAILAAETVEWPIFLRAHLNIMNDRFDRVSDGSWAWAGRQTYIGELEALDLNIGDLIFGISLRVENAHDNHYYGSIGRLGRALAETQNADEIEAEMLEMIKDDALDDYNRVSMYYLFSNYVYYQKEDAQKVALNAKLREAVKSMPDYLSSHIKIEDK